MDKYILIVDDEALFAFSVSRQLKRMGYHVIQEIAVTGEQAVQIARVQSPAVILLDIGLAGEMNGIQTAHEIRRFCSAAIIFITGYPENLVQHGIEDLNRIVLLEKPLEESQLKKSIEQYI